MDERPSYYAVIPADVRYDDQIPANAKLLYGEISALIGADGFCYASNQYFAGIYRCSDVTISRLISSLEDAGYIKREITRDGSGQVSQRKIYLNVSAPEIQPLNNFDNPPLQNCGEGLNKIVKKTNLSNTDIDKENKKESPPPKGDRTKKTDYDPTDAFAAFITGVACDHHLAQSLMDAMSRFAENRRAIKKPIPSQASVTALCNKLLKYSGGNAGVMIELLDTATSSGWQTVYPAKNSAAPSGQSTSGRDREWL